MTGNSFTLEVRSSVLIGFAGGGIDLFVPIAEILFVFLLKRQSLLSRYRMAAPRPADDSPLPWGLNLGWIPSG